MLGEVRRGAEHHRVDDISADRGRAPKASRRAPGIRAPTRRRSAGAEAAPRRRSLDALTAAVAQHSNGGWRRSRNRSHMRRRRRMSGAPTLARARFTAIRAGRTRGAHQELEREVVLRSAPIGPTTAPAWTLPQPAFRTPTRWRIDSLLVPTLTTPRIPYSGTTFLPHRSHCATAGPRHPVDAAAHNDADVRCRHGSIWSALAGGITVPLVGCIGLQGSCRGPAARLGRVARRMAGARRICTETRSQHSAERPHDDPRRGLSVLVGTTASCHTVSRRAGQHRCSPGIAAHRTSLMVMDAGLLVAVITLFFLIALSPRPPRSPFLLSRTMRNRRGSRL